MPFAAGCVLCVPPKENPEPDGCFVVWPKLNPELEPKVFPVAAFFCGDSIAMSPCWLFPGPPVPFSVANGFGVPVGAPNVKELDWGG